MVAIPLMAMPPTPTMWTLRGTLRSSIT
jgi:hypothetical protein